MTPAERKFLLLVVACLMLLVSGLVIDAWFIPIRVLTTFKGQPALSPLYAFWMPCVSPRIFWAIATGVGYGVWVWNTCNNQPATLLSSVLRLLITCGWLAVFAVAVASIRLPIEDLGASMHAYPGEEFWDDVEKVKSPGWFLTHFTRLQSHRDLSIHGLAHPPGHTLFLWGVTRLFGRSTEAAAIAILAVGSTGLIPVCLLARRIFGDRTANRVLALFPVVPSITMYAISATDFLFFALAAWSMWLAVEAVLANNAVVAIAAGLLAGLSATFSFAEGFVGIIVGLFALAHLIHRPGTAVHRQLCWMATGLVAWYVMLRLGLGFDWFESLGYTHRFHRYVIEREIGRYTPLLWFYTSIGNLFAFTWYLGAPAVAGAALCLVATFRSGMWTGGLDRQFTRAVALTLAVMVFGALFLLEVERIWLYMVGPLLAVASSAMPVFESPEPEKRLMSTLALIMCLQSIIYESVLYTIW